MPRAGGIGGHGPVIGGGGGAGAQEEVKAGAHSVGGVLVQVSLEDAGGVPDQRGLDGGAHVDEREDKSERDRRRPEKSMP